VDLRVHAQTAEKVPRQALVFDGSLLYLAEMLKMPEGEQDELEIARGFPRDST
jgi:hypothetical protein